MTRTFAQADDREAQGAAAPVAALLLALLFCVPSLFARGLLPPDESRYADVALAMQESGDWLVPRLHEKWYFEKGPVFFWAVAGLDQLGVPIDAAPRLASLLAALGLLALMPRLARGCGLAPASGTRGALVLIAMPLFASYAQLGFIDPLFSLAIALAAACKLERGRREGRLAPWLLAVAEGVVVTFALLTKGPVALLFLAGLRVGAALARRSAADGTAGTAAVRRGPGAWDRLDLLVLLVALAGAGGWLLAAAGRAGGDYAWQLTLGQFERRIAGTEPKHHVPPGFLIAVVLVGGLPWTLLALWRAARDATLRPPPRIAGLLGWALLPVALLACLPTQQPHYALPALPAVALLAGEALAEPLSRGARRAAGAVGVAAGVGLLAVAAYVRWFLDPNELDPLAVRRVSHDAVVLAAIAAGGVAFLAAVAWPPPGATRNVPLRALASMVALALVTPLVWWRTDDLLRPRALLESPALAKAKRIVAPTGLRSSVRLATRLPRIDEYDGRTAEELLAADPGLVAIEWRNVLVASGQLARLHVLAAGFLRGEALVAVRGPRAPAPEPSR